MAEISRLKSSGSAF